MLLGYLLVVVITLVVWLRVKWGKVRRHWAERGVPYEAPHPLLGSLTFLQKENPVYWMRRVYNKFKAPYVGIWLFWQPGLIINSPELARRILVKDADNFRNRFLSSGRSDPVGGLNLFTIKDPLWTSVRRRLVGVFTSTKLRAFEGLVREKVQDLVERYETEIDKNPEDINVRVINTDYTTDLIGEASFGVQSRATKTGDSAFRKVTRDFGSFSVYRGICWSSTFFFPSLVDVFRFSFFPKEAVSFLRQLFRGMAAQRGGLNRPVKEPKDLLDALLKMRQDAAADNEDMDEDLLVAQAAGFLQAGFDSSGSALTWAFKELAHSPQVQEKLFQELNNATGVVGGKPDGSALAKVSYLNAIIKETLRKYPSMGWFDRVAANDYQLDEKLVVPAGTPLYVNATGLMMDPEYFPDPEVFDPERFMPENEKNIKPYTFMPFGEGPRNCIGTRFAYLSMRFAISAVVRRFRLRPPRGAAPPNAWPGERRGLFYSPAGKITLIFTPRN